MTGATKRDVHRLVALETVDRSGDDHWLFNDYVSWCATCSCGWDVPNELTEGTARATWEAHKANPDDPYGFAARFDNVPREELTWLVQRLYQLRHEAAYEGRPYAALWLGEGGMAGCVDAIREQNARVFDLEMQANGGHLPLRTIHEDDGYYSASCRCGWECGGFPDQTSGDAAVRQHIEQFWASVPDGQEVFASHCNAPANNDHPSPTCMNAVDRACRECGAVRYVGPDCEHVAQPPPVDAEGRCLNCRDAGEGANR